MEPYRIEALDVLTHPEVRELLTRGSQVVQIGVDTPDGLSWLQSRVLREDPSTGALWVADPGPLPSGQPLGAGDGVSVFLRSSSRELVFDTTVLSRDTQGLDSAGRSPEPALLLEMPRTVHTCARRRHARVVPGRLTRATVRVSADSGHLSTEARVGDLSQGGAYLVCHRPYPAFARAAQPGAMVVVGLIQANLGRVVIDLLATVVRVGRKPGPEQDLAIGVEWIAEGHEEALRRLDELLRTEIRGALRRKLGGAQSTAR